MADWLQTRRELLCLDIVNRFGPVDIGFIGAMTGMPIPVIQKHVGDMAERGCLASYEGRDDRSGQDDVTLWIVQQAEPRAGWAGESLTMFCGEEPPSVMDESDAFDAGEEIA